MITENDNNEKIPYVIASEVNHDFPTENNITILFEKFGIENFCKECNKETATNIDIVKKVTDQMGQFIDMENPYITCSNEFIESEWWLIKNIFDQGLIHISEESK